MSSVRGLVIIGGGAAGIGAADEARKLGVDALIVEASDRLGGRAHSIEWNGHALDLGCTWMHSAERNSLRVEAERLGLIIDRNPTGWFSQYRDLGFSPEDREAAFGAFYELEERMRTSPPDSDRASDALQPGNPWNPWLQAISSYINGASLEQVSIADWLAYDNASTDQNWRLPGGYGTLVAQLGAQFDHRLGSPVIAVSRFPDSVRVETANGVIECERAVVTVPTSTLQRVRFDPPIAGIVEAATELPLGLADKLFLSLDEAKEFPHGAHLAGNPRSSETGSYFLNPMGIPVVEGFFGGSGARALEELGDEGAAAFMADELAALLGSGIRKRVKPIARSRWAHHDWIRGSYSHALPGQTAMRQRLAEAGDDRIAFAGEAVSAGDYSTAHGAFDSGRDAVRRLLSTR